MTNTRIFRAAATCAASLMAIGAIAACGSSSATGGGGSSETSTTSAAANERVPVGVTGTQDQFVTMQDVCKGSDKDLTVGFAWGFSGNAARKIFKQNFINEAAKCPNIKKIIYTDAQLSPQKAVSDINSLVAQGANIILVYPDAGEALIPAMRKATQAGVTVIPWATGAFAGTPGTDYYDIQTEVPQESGKQWAQWMAKVTGGKGNFVLLSGPAGNPTGIAELEGIKSVLAKYPNMKLLVDTPVATDWDPAKAQQVMAGLLTKYPKIDGVFTDYGGMAVGAMRAFTAAGRTLPPFASEDENQFACAWQKNAKANPGFEVATTSTREWITEPALRRAVAVQLGPTDKEPSRIALPLYEDSTSSDAKLKPRCNPSLPPDASFSSGLPDDQLKKLFG